jgi:hypothetical protein
LAVLFYGLVPIAGAFVERQRWRFFRRRLGELRLRPHLDYAGLTSAGELTEEYRFCGAFESVSDGGPLWIRSRELTVQADLSNALTYIFPNTGGEDSPYNFDLAGEVPERIRWDRISALTGDAKVFVGGPLVRKENRRIFASMHESPLLIIFYEGSEKALAIGTVSAGRHRNEFFNFITPYSFILGAFSQILIAVSFLSRPAYLSTMIAALIALFTPIIPLIPPGILFTIAYRRLWSLARMYRAYRDLARLPLGYIRDKDESQLPNGEVYGIRCFDELPVFSDEKRPPFLIPANEKRNNALWYICGALRSGNACPEEPKDPFAAYGVLPGECESLALRYNRRAYSLAVISWIFLLASIGANVFFIGLILSQIRV